MTEPATAVQFEARHAELREAVERYQEAWQNAEVDGSSLIAADHLLDSFRSRTAKPLDAAVAALRELLKAGQHDGPCESGGPFSPCWHHEEAYSNRVQAGRAALADLDEMAARG